MTIERVNRDNYDPDNFTEWHRLVVAEDGFSVLDSMGCYEFGLQAEVIRAFAEEVNCRDEGGSLHPRAPISALPRRYFREVVDNGGIPDHLDSFKKELRDFIEANRRTIRAKKILVDFHVSPEPVPEAYVDAVVEVFGEAGEASGIEDVSVVE